MTKNNVGTITQVLGAVVDVRFDAGLPSFFRRSAPKITASR